MKREGGKKSHVSLPNLPLHLLQLVSSQLRLIDYLNFRYVCSTWRTVAKQHNPCLDYPLLMIPDRHVSNVCFFVSASDGRCCKMRLPEISLEYYCVGCFMDGC